MNNIISQVKLQNGEDLIIRKAETKDGEKMIDYLQNIGGESDNLLFGKGEFHLSLEQEKKFIETTNSSPNTIILIGLIHDEIISVAQVTGKFRKRIEHNAEIAISVKKSHWHQGVGSHMMTSLINFSKSTNTIKTLSLGVKASNANAIKLYEKFGFRNIGVHKNFFNVNGQFDDEILMDLFL